MLQAALGDRQGKIRAADVWTILGVPPGQRSQAQNAALGEAMKCLGWTKKKLRFGGRYPENAYVGGAEDKQIVVERVPDTNEVFVTYKGDAAGANQRVFGDDDAPF
jgi:hypothetical protein